MRYLVVAAVMAVGLGVFGIRGASAAPANGKVISDGASRRATSLKFGAVAAVAGTVTVGAVAFHKTPNPSGVGTKTKSNARHQGRALAFPPPNDTDDGDNVFGFHLPSLPARESRSGFAIASHPFH
jgi:hypothetical protein